MRLLFAGTPEVALPSLRLLLAQPQHDVVAVLTRPPARSGRGRIAHESPVAAVATAAGVPVLCPHSPADPEFLAELTEFEIDCAPVVAYGAILRPATLAVPKHGWVNLHFSLLPAWRGAAPVQRALLRGDDLTGASTFLIGEGLDDGPVFGVVTEAVRATDTSGDLLARLADSGARLLLATMDGIADASLRPQPQPVDGVSTAPKLSSEDARVRVADPAFAVDRRVRACTPAPGAWLLWRDERLKIGPVQPIHATTELAPGELATQAGHVLVGTATDAVRLGWVQPPGKKPMPAVDWARGARLAPGERLE